MPTMATGAPARAWRASRWTLAREAIVASLLLPVIALPAFLGVQILTVPEVAPFLVLFVALAAANVWSANRWVQLAGGLVAAGFAGLNIAFIYPELARADHYPMFFLAWLVVLGGTTGVVAGIQGFRQARAEVATRPRWGSAGTVLVLLAAGFAGGTLVATVGMRVSDTGVGASVALTPEAEISVALEDFAFAPETMSIPADRIVRITIANRDGETHTFSIDALGIGQEVPSGKSAEVWIRAPAGTYQVYCEPHSSATDAGREGMLATLVVG